MKDLIYLNRKIVSKHLRAKEESSVPVYCICRELKPLYYIFLL